MSNLRLLTVKIDTVLTWPLLIDLTTLKIVGIESDSRAVDLQFLLKLLDRHSLLKQLIKSNHQDPDLTHILKPYKLQISGERRSQMISTLK